MSPLENEHEANVTRYWIGHFTESLRELEAKEAVGLGDEFTRYQIRSHNSQLEELKEMVAEYEKQHPKATEAPS